MITSSSARDLHLGLFHRPVVVAQLSCSCERLGQISKLRQVISNIQITFVVEDVHLRLAPGRQFAVIAATDFRYGNLVQAELVGRHVDLTVTLGAYVTVLCHVRALEEINAALNDLDVTFRKEDTLHDGRLTHVVTLSAVTKK